MEIDLEFQVLAMTVIVLSTISILAYGCSINFKQSSIGYMTYLMYYRSARCFTQVEWQRLNGIDEPISIQPQMPSETEAVFRTIIFAILYLIIGIFLAITSFGGFCESFSIAVD
jgi:hypothetical protein